MKALKSVVDGLAKVGIKAPWRYTGSWTTPDYLHYLPTASEYRRVAPGSNTVKAKVPSDHPSLVYDIKYFVRDHRRSSSYTARTVDAKTGFDFDKMFANAPLKPEEVKTIPRPPVMPTRGF